MKIRAISTILGLIAALGTGPAFAQQQTTVARLSDMEGNVLVSEADAMAAATSNQRVAVGARVLTTAGAKVTIKYDGGCDIRLKENERFTVRMGECPVLLTEVVPLGPAVGAIGGGVAAGSTGVTVGNVITGVAIGGAVGYGAYEAFKKAPVSPN